jgi:hypothetical protein
VARVEEPDPGGQLDRHVENLLAQPRPSVVQAERPHRGPIGPFDGPHVTVTDVSDGAIRDVKTRAVLLDPALIVAQLATYICVDNAPAARPQGPGCRRNHDNADHNPEPHSAS